MNPAEFSIKNRLISFIVIALTLLGGWLAYEDMARFEDPEFIIREARVITRYPGATPQEVSEEVTDRLEIALQEMQEVKELRSESSEGLSIITVEIKFEFSKTKAELQAVWTKMRDKVSDATRSLPPGAVAPVVNDDFGDVFGVYYVLTGPGYTDRELREYAKDLRTLLLTGDGVGKVDILGVQQEAVYIEIERERASRLGVSLVNVLNDLSQQNAVVAAGNVVVDDQRMIITPSGSIDTVSAIENLIVSNANSDTVVYLKDIAQVERTYLDPPQQIIRYNGEHALAIGVANVTGANVVTMGESLDQLLAEQQALQPAGMEVHEFYHQGKIVDVAVTDFLMNVIAALVIVLVTLLVFMGYQSAVIIGSVLVVTIAATLATMELVDIPMHRVSLGALIIALGMLVDNAIVVTEGILVGIKSGGKKLDIAVDVVRRSSWPLLGGTVVGILAFAPIGFAPGNTAEFTKHLFWVILISLFYSWVFAITIVPLLADLLFKQTSSDADAEATPSAFMVMYKRLIATLLHFRWLTVALCAALFVVSIWGAQFIKPGFFPNSTSPQIVIDFWMPEGTDIHATNRELIALEKDLGALEGVEDVQTILGAGTLRYMLVYVPQTPNGAYGQLLLRVSDLNQIDRLLGEIQELIGQKNPAAQAEVRRFKLGPGTGSKIEAVFSGRDPAVLRDLADQAKAIMAAELDAISIKDNWRQQTSVIQPLYSESRGRRLGISREDFARALQTNYSGQPVGVFRENDELIPIIARAPADERADAEGLVGIQLVSPVTGKTVPIIELMDGLDRVWRDAIIHKTNRVLQIKAQADPRHGVLAGDLQERLAPAIEAIELPPGYSMHWGGEAGDSAEANAELATTIPAGLISMIVIVIFLFNAVKQAVIIWSAVPLALIGVVAGLLLTGLPLEFLALLGLLSLSGLLVKNAIVLVDQMDQEIKAGKPRMDAVIDSAASRVRPVMMGSLTTVLGVVPLYFDAFFQSMSVVLMFGLSFATLLTLLVVPALYAIIFNVRADERAQP